jgi:2'-5' RNA ligase
MGMRVFVGIDLEAEVRRGIVRFTDEVRALAPDARWVNPESLHVTLKFIGEQTDARAKEIEGALQTVKGRGVEIAFGGCGFFPAARAARVFWIGIQSAALPQLAGDVEETLARVAVPREQRAYSPHLTVARAAGGSGAPGWRKGDVERRVFAELQRELAKSPAPGFGSMSAREFFLYRSEVGPGGARYTKIARFGLEKQG